MVHEHFKLNRMPFSSAPDTSLLVNVPTMVDVLQRARMCIDSGSGITVIVGQPGTGKSLLLEKLAEENRSRFVVAKVSCPRLRSRAELMQSILFEIKRPFRSTSESELRLSLIDYVKNSDACAKGLLLLIDEAHMLSRLHLDELRQLTNIVRDGKPGVRLVLCGGLALEDRLNHAKAEPFNQRVTGRFYLHPLTRDETYFYTLSQVKSCGRDGRELFDPAALDALHKLSDGVPRIINQICSHAMYEAASQGKRTINSQLIRQTWADIQSIPLPTNEGWLPQTTEEESVLEFGTLRVESEVSSIGPQTTERTDSSVDEVTSKIDYGSVGTSPNQNQTSTNQVQIPGSQVEIDRLVQELVALDGTAQDPSPGRTHHDNEPTTHVDFEHFAGGDRVGIQGLAESLPHSWELHRATPIVAEQPIIGIAPPFPNPEEDNVSKSVVHATTSTNESAELPDAQPFESDTGADHVENPFAFEEFPEEEEVDDPWFALAVQSNGNSTTLSKADVEVLQNQAVEQVSQLSHIEFISADSATRSNTPPHHFDADNLTTSYHRGLHEQNYPAEVDLDVAYSVEYPITMHPQYQSDAMSMGDEVTEDASKSIGNAQRKPIAGGFADDRDMIVVKRSETIVKEKQAEVKVQSTRPVSQGRAVRVELRELFQQLRSTDDAP
ncbi:MAG TPA: AAA family ATPase [Pirellulaceae bacterium]|nr:AAA family ATPase [Pirellulaceae bacterium]